MGTRMASPSVNLFMGDFEYTALQNTPYKPQIWRRFNDEILEFGHTDRTNLTNLLTTLIPHMIALNLLLTHPLIPYTS